jgi:hypothetical protein
VVVAEEVRELVRLVNRRLEHLGSPGAQEAKVVPEILRPLSPLVHGLLGGLHADGGERLAPAPVLSPQPLAGGLPALEVPFVDRSVGALLDRPRKGVLGRLGPGALAGEREP